MKTTTTHYAMTFILKNGNEEECDETMRKEFPPSGDHKFVHLLFEVGDRRVELSLKDLITLVLNGVSE